jgi:hypothetical protein
MTIIKETPTFHARQLADLIERNQWPTGPDERDFIFEMTRLVLLWQNMKFIPRNVKVPKEEFFWAVVDGKPALLPIKSGNKNDHH